MYAIMFRETAKATCRTAPTGDCKGSLVGLPTGRKVVPGAALAANRTLRVAGGDWNACDRPAACLG